MYIVYRLKCPILPVFKRWLGWVDWVSCSRYTHTATGFMLVTTFNIKIIANKPAKFMLTNNYRLVLGCFSRTT